MGKKKAKRKRGNKKIPIAPLVGISVMLYRLYLQFKAAGGDPQTEIRNMTLALTGFDPVEGTFHWQELAATYGAPIAGGLIHKYVGGSKGLNINASIRGIPFVSI